MNQNHWGFNFEIFIFEKSNRNKLHVWVYVFGISNYYYAINNRFKYFV